MGIKGKNKIMPLHSNTPSNLCYLPADTPRVRPSPGLVWESARSGQCRADSGLLRPDMARTGRDRGLGRDIGGARADNGQQSEIRPRSEQISAELPALIRHQAFPQSRLNFCDQDSRSTISNLPVTRLWSVLPSFYLSSYNSRLGRNRQIKNSIPFHSKSSIKI